MEAVATALGGVGPAATRVLLVASRATGGMARHVTSLMIGLRAEGYQLAVACAPDSVIAQAARDRALPVYGITTYTGGNLTRATWGAVQLATAAAGFQAHVIHTHSFNAGVVGAFSTYLTHSSRLVATIHSYPPTMESGRSPDLSTRLAVRVLLARAARVIWVSESLGRDLLKYYPAAAGKASMIPNGVDTQAEPKQSPAQVRAALRLPPAGPLVGMAARLAPQKGIREFIQAARLLCDRDPHVHLLLAGAGPLWEEAKRLQGDLNLSDRLHLLGEVTNAREIMNALDVLVVASTSEGSSIVAMEAMALGKPVVGTAVGGVPEVVVDGVTGLLVQPGDPAALADAVGRLLADPARAQEMGDRGRQRAAAQFDVRVMIDRVKEVYADVMREMLSAGRHER